MSRQELAEAVNAFLWERYRQVGSLDGNYVGKLESGRHRWPNARYRQGFRHVLDADSDTEIGFYVSRGSVSVQEPTAAPDDAPASALTLDDLQHIALAFEDARRYLDAEVTGHLDRRLTELAMADGIDGPDVVMPATLAVIGVVERGVRLARPAVRRGLCSVGARGAEFAGWLYRDAGMAERADYWRDRAVEWAYEAGDYVMPAYVLLKKSQSAWDSRDGPRMLALAQAVVDGPWPLPLRVQAEAAQQVARGHAMVEGDMKTAAGKLAEAQELLNADTESALDDRPPVAAHYDRALFDLQAAMCLAEAGDSDQAVERYQEVLSPLRFSRRDHAYFLSLKAQALAAESRPAEAAEAGMSALAVAADTRSMRTVTELRRLGTRLRPWSGDSEVGRFLAALQEP